MTRTLIRKGKCNHCGLCCGFGLEKPCEYFDSETHLCRVWRIGQPTYCRNFPKHPRAISQHWDACGFRFYDSETGQEVTMKKRKNAAGDWECDWDELYQYADVVDDC